MRIETGTTNERLARCGIMALALLAFAVWFAVDGWYRYPRQALEVFQKYLKLDDLPTPHPKLAYHYPREPRQKYGMAVRKGLAKSKVLADLGKPLKIVPDPATKNDHWHYVGQYGRLDLEVEPRSDPNIGNVVSAAWEQVPSDYRHESVVLQKIFAGVCGVLGVIALGWLIKVWRTHVVVDDDGLTYDRLVVPWDAVDDLDSSRYHAKGLLALVYASEKGERRLMLDSYKVDAFDEVVDAICQRKDFPNPIPIPDYGDVDEEADAHVGADESVADNDADTDDPSHEAT